MPTRVYRTYGVQLVLVLVLGAVTVTTVAAQQVAVFPGVDWEERTPESQGLDASKLQAAVEYLKANVPHDGTDELVIICHGFLIWKGPHIDRVHETWSVTKSFTSTVLGLLVDDGRIMLDTKVQDVLPSLAMTYPDVTFRHLATMTSGYQAVGDVTTGWYTWGPSATPFTLSPTPLFSPPGTQYAYWDSAMNQFANALTRVAGEPIRSFFKRRIADPIGMPPERWIWGEFGAVDGIVVNGGAGNHGVGIWTSARVLARLGYLFLHRGQWDTRQLLSAAWVDAATRPQVPLSLSLATRERSPADGRGTYGFNWWTNGLKRDGTRPWPDAPPSTYAASGFNNNRLFVLPDWHMVIVRLGQDQLGGFAIRANTWSAFLRQVGEAILPASRQTR